MIWWGGKIMVKTHVFSSKCVASCLICSIILNLLFVINIYVGHDGEWKKQQLSWSSRAAAEAEAVAALSCSGHGRAYLDGLAVDANIGPVCECNTCYTGPDCSQFIPHCAANAERYLPFTRGQKV